MCYVQLYGTQELNMICALYMHKANYISTTFESCISTQTMVKYIHPHQLEHDYNLSGSLTGTGTQTVCAVVA